MHTWWSNTTTNKWQEIKIHAIPLFWSRQAIKMRENRARWPEQIWRMTTIAFASNISSVCWTNCACLRVYMELKGRIGEKAGRTKERKAWESVDWFIGKKRGKAKGEQRKQEKKLKGKCQRERKRKREGEREREETKITQAKLNRKEWRVLAAPSSITFRRNANTNKTHSFCFQHVTGWSAKDKTM